MICKICNENIKITGLITLLLASIYKMCNACDSILSVKEETKEWDRKERKVLDYINNKRLTKTKHKLFKW